MRHALSAVPNSANMPAIFIYIGIYIQMCKDVYNSTQIAISCVFLFNEDLCFEGNLRVQRERGARHVYTRPLLIYVSCIVLLHSRMETICKPYILTH
jgi:hypothetical protein